MRLGEIRVLHAQRLRLRLGLDRGTERHRVLALEHLLGHRVRERRAGGELGGPLLGQRDRGITVGDDPIDEADPLGMRAIDHLAKEQQLARVAEPHDPRQEVRGAHVRAAQPDLREDETEPCMRRGDPEITRRRDHRTGTDGDPVDRRDHRALACSDRFDQAAGRTRERDERGGVATQQLLDDIVLITARAEATPAPGDHHGADLGDRVELLERLGELLVALERQRVEPLRAIERDRRDARDELVVERGRRDHDSCSR